MSDDLISRKALLQDMKNSITENSDTFDWINLINKQSTAYDVDKVVERLDNYLFEKHCIEGDGEIVKILEGGGVDE